MLVYRDNAYNFVLLLHIVSIVAAFAPTVVTPLLTTQLAAEDSAVRGRLMGYMAANGKRVHAPALVLAGLFGIGLIVMSDEVIRFDDKWVNLAFLVWFAMNGVLHGLILPGERRLARGDESGEGRLKMGGTAIDLLFVAMLYLMIFKPG